MVRGKGSVTAQQSWVRQARDVADPVTARLLDRLRQVTTQIVGLSVGERPSYRSSGFQDVPAALRELSNERTRLEQQLTDAVRLSASSRAEPGRASEVRAALPRASSSSTSSLMIIWNGSGQRTSRGGKRRGGVRGPAEAKGGGPGSTGSSLALADLIDRWRNS